MDPNQPIVKVERRWTRSSRTRSGGRAFGVAVLGAGRAGSAADFGWGVQCDGVYDDAAGAGDRIRVALGAEPRNVVAVIVKGAMIPLVTGLVVSGVASLFLRGCWRACCTK